MDTMKSHWAYSSRKSFKQISTCNSPQPAMMCSPLSSVVHTTRGSDLDNFFNPSTNFGNSLPTLTTGETLYFMSAMLWASSMVVKVPDFNKYWSTPTKATVLPQGTSGICSTVRPIMSTVL